MDDREEEKELLTTVDGVQHVFTIGIIPLLAQLAAVDREMFESQHPLKMQHLTEVKQN